MAVLAPPRAGARPSHSAADSYRHGFTSAVTVAALGLLTVTVLVLVGWATAPHADAGVLDAVRAAGRLWLLAHGTALTLGTGPFDLVPLLLTGAMWVLLAAGAIRGLRQGKPGRGRTAALAAGLVAGYALPALTVALLLGMSGGAGAGALVDAALLAGSAFVAGVWREQPESFRLPARILDACSAATSGLVTLLAGGAVLAVVAVLTSLPAITAATHRLGPGWTGGALLLLAELAYAPVLAIWGAAVAVGPGIAVGAGVVDLTGSTVTGAPAVPVLAALPSGGTSGLTYVAMLVPVLAGVLLGRSACKRSASASGAVGLAMASGALTGVMMALLCLPASGPLAAGYYARVGPSPAAVGIATALELAIAGGITAALSGWRRRRD